MKPMERPALRPSVIDRLYDLGYGRDTDGSWYSGADEAVAISRDMEDLLNTNCAESNLAENYPQTAGSIIGYGLPDMGPIDAQLPAGRRIIERTVREIIVRFEPRLKDINVKVSSVDHRLRTISLTISGRLITEPAPHLTFEALMELSSGRYRIKPSGAN